ncbi:MAG: hypothetical protein ACLT33_08235 [Lachnospira pectinoschiza]
MFQCLYLYVNIRLVNQLKLLEPFGKGNEKPVFADRNLYIKTASVIGKNKNVLRCQLETEDGTYVLLYSLELII